MKPPSILLLSAYHNEFLVCIILTDGHCKCITCICFIHMYIKSTRLRHIRVEGSWVVTCTKRMHKIMKQCAMMKQFSYKMLKEIEMEVLKTTKN